MATEITLRYGCNPHQAPARVFAESGNLPFTVINGAPGYVNLLDALNSWQLVRELKAATGRPAAASFKHVSPAGAAIANPLSDVLRQAYMVGDEPLSPLATAYARARGGDRLASYGDFAALSDVVDEATARLIRPESSDGLIAPGYSAEALRILKAKRDGKYLLLQIDPAYEPPAIERRHVFGVAMEQPRNNARIGPELFRNVVTQNKTLPDTAVRDLLVATIAAKYAQSNTVCVAYDGQVIGLGAGQQSRIHCTRLACDKADKWMLQQHPRVLGMPFRDGLKRPEKANAIDQFLLWDQLSDAEKEQLRSTCASLPDPIGREERAEWIARFAAAGGASLSSDAFIPFRDNLDRANKSAVRYVAQTGGSIADAGVIAAADAYNMTMVFTGLRLFHH
jgi:phosphoribosylaminoimidazolecarboxamide formyltransferase / IMP cyclohydrolase